MYTYTHIHICTPVFFSLKLIKLRLRITKLLACDHITNKLMNKKQDLQLAW